MSFRFENLEIWTLSREFVLLIYKITKSFPEEEKFGLTLQLRRAAISVSLNIVEGSDRKSDKEFIRFLRISLASLEEVIAGLYLALDLNFMNKKDFDSVYEGSRKLVAKIVSLIKKLGGLSH